MRASTREEAHRGRLNRDIPAARCAVDFASIDYVTYSGLRVQFRADEPRLKHFILLLASISPVAGGPNVLRT